MTSTVNSQSLPVVDERNFERAQASAITDNLVPLLSYQAASIADKTRVKVLKWCRQAGKDFTTSLEGVLDALESGQDWFIVSLTQRQSLATAQKAQMHVRAIFGVLAEIEEGEHEYDLNGVRKAIKTFGVRLPNGARVVALPGRDPDAIAGLTGNVILTEFALFPNNGVDHWRVIFPLITRGFRVVAISTPRGHQTKFAELCRNPHGKYSVHVVTIEDAVAGGLVLRDEDGKPISVGDLRKLYNDESGWSREYMCQEGEDHEPLIAWEHIHNCLADYAIPRLFLQGMDGLINAYNPAADNFFGPIVTKMSGQPLLGWDIAVKRDLSAMPLGELLGDVVWLRGLVLMHKVNDFDYQESVAAVALSLGTTGVGDASGLGMASCQRLEKRFGEHRFKGLTFTSGSKLDLCVNIMQRIQGGRWRSPREDMDVQYDLHSLGRKPSGVAGRMTITSHANPLLPMSHSDIAIGCAMMCDAAAGDLGPADGMLIGNRSGSPMGPAARWDDDDGDDRLVSSNDRIGGQY